MMKKKMLNVQIMTKHLVDKIAKEVAVREKKAEKGIAVRRGQIKGDKNQ
jgi:hypothetical protein